MGVARFTVLEGRAHIGTAERHVHPHAFMGAHVLDEPARGALGAMLVIATAPTVTQPIHDPFRIARPHTVTARVVAKIHAATGVFDVDDPYLLAHNH